MDVVIDYFLIILRSRKTCLILNDMCRDAVICRSSRKYAFVSHFLSLISVIIRSVVRDFGSRQNVMEQAD